MITQGIVVACILGTCPLIEKHILGYIHIESFLIISAILFFLVALLYTLLVHAKRNKPMNLYHVLETRVTRTRCHRKKSP